MFNYCGEKKKQAGWDLVVAGGDRRGGRGAAVESGALQNARQSDPHLLQDRLGGPKVIP